MSVSCGIIGVLFAVTIYDWRFQGGVQEEMVDRHKHARSRSDDLISDHYNDSRLSRKRFKLTRSRLSYCDLSKMTKPSITCLALCCYLDIFRRAGALN